MLSLTMVEVVEEVVAVEVLLHLEEVVEEEPMRSEVEEGEVEGH